MKAFLVIGMKTMGDVGRKSLGAFVSFEAAMGWVQAGNVPPEFPLFGVAQVDNAVYRLMGMRVGTDKWERLPGNFGDSYEKADQARFHALQLGDWKEVVIGLDWNDPSAN